MILKVSKGLAIAFCCSAALSLTAQSPLSLELKKEVEKKKNLHFLNDGPSSLLASDIDIINNYNFEAYRKPNVRVKIQLVKGPLIELLANNEVPQSTEPTKPLPEKQDSLKTYDIILQLNIGLGYQKKQHTEVIR